MLVLLTPRNLMKVAWELFLHIVILVVTGVLTVVGLPLLTFVRFCFKVGTHIAKQKDARNTVVVVTGAASGFGRGLTERLTKAGAIVFAVDIDEAGLRTLPVTCPASCLRTMCMDVANVEDCRALVLEVTRYCQQNHTTLYGLVNNAGVAGRPGAGFEFDDATIDRVFSVNVLGPIRLTRELFPLLKASKEARILNVTSLTGLVASRGLSLYSASKSALESYTEALRQEAPRNVKVTIVNPYYAQTNIYRSLREGGYEHSVLRSDVERFRSDLEQGKVPGMMSCGFVTKHMFDALYTTFPRDRYIVAPTAITVVLEIAMHMPNYFGVRDSVLRLVN
eukprot:PhM_4_TR17503/c0_g1_i1/m.973